MSTVERSLAVLGSPIGHSKSPLLHRAAYRELALPWGYEAIEATGETLAGFVSTRDDSWLGLSLTMPLKRDILPLVDERDALVERTGTANTVLFGQRDGARYLRAFNTDVFGITESFQRRGFSTLGTVHILGGGATAASAIAAVGRLGARAVTVFVRDPARAAGLVAVGEADGVVVTIDRLENAVSAPAPGALISTLPTGVEAGLVFGADTRARAILLDVAYEPSPTPLGAQWLAAGGTVIDGIDMLIHQALVQVRIFSGSGPDAVLDGESNVLAAMRAAVGA